MDGIEQSRDMVDRMREKPGGNTIEVTIGDMSRVTTGRTYGMVYLVYNTIGNLLTQDDQVRCFQNATRHLAGDGVFVLECRVPSAPARPGHQYVDPEHIAAGHVMLDAGRYDPLTQILDLNHVHISADGIILVPISLRLAHPPEFDLMARIAGLRVRERWGGWSGERFTAGSWRRRRRTQPPALRGSVLCRGQLPPRQDTAAAAKQAPPESAARRRCERPRGRWSGPQVRLNIPA